MGKAELVRNVPAAVMLWLVAEAALAQLRPVGPIAQLLAPSTVSPLGGVAYDYSVPDVAFIWDQRPLLQSPHTALPTHFLFCLQAPEMRRTCTHSTALENLLPGSMQSALLRSPITHQPVGYRYFFTPTIPDHLLDRAALWSVASCTTIDDSSCRLSAWSWVNLSTVDLRAGNITGNVFGDTYRLAAEGQNLGSRPTSELPVIPIARIRTWRVLMDSISETCRIDPNAADIRDESDYYVIDNKGEFTRFAVLPRDQSGNYIVNNVVAIFGAGDPSTEYRAAEIDLSGLPLGPSTPLQGSLDISVPSADRPVAFATVLGMDDQQSLYEVDESNNKRAECEVIFR
jgi:hypothetical protein